MKNNFYSKHLSKKLKGCLQAASLLLLLLSFSFAALANDIVVKGKVIGLDGSPLAGASVKVSGGTGTSTDGDGNYSISVKENATLTFSYVGFASQTVNVAGRTVINITLASDTQLEEQVVVVGYGTQKKRDLTGSISSVKGDEIANMPSTNPIASLQGKVPGLTIANSGNAGSNPVVRIRGINSTNSASPVYVVDGILLDDISFLNPNDIESIDVLRDPSSIAIYGLRGANGVIAVTTKKAARGKTRVTLSSSVGWQKVNNTIDVVDASGFRSLWKQQERNANITDTFDFRGYTGNTNWQDEILRTALITSHNLGVSTSGERSTTSFNLGYTNQDGVVGNDNFERFMVRFTQELKVGNNIKVGGSFTGYHSINTPQGVSVTNALWALPIIPVQFAPDVYYSTPSLQRPQVFNPVGTMNRLKGNTIDKDYRIVGNVFAELKFLKNFTFRSTLYGDLNFGSTRTYNPLPFTVRDIGEGGNPRQRDSTVLPTNSSPSITQNQAERRRYQQDHVLTYDKKIDSRSSITGTLGFTTLYNENTFTNTFRRDTSVNIPNNPDFYYINIAGVNNPGNYSGGGGTNAQLGGFARASYSYMNRYLVNATIRRDGSSKFGPDYRYGTFGSVGLGWVMSDEAFMQKIKPTVNFLKLRAAWGVTGNSNGIPDNLYQPSLNNASTAVFGNNIFTSLRQAYIVDPNIRFETVEGIDIGFDARLFKNKLTAEVTFYDRTTSDILSSTDIPNDTRRAFKNLGEITNSGIEVGLGWNEKLRNGFSYGISANFSYNKNRVNSIGDKIDFSLVGNGGANLTKIGQSIGYFYGYRQTGIYQSTADIAKLPAFSTSLPGDISYADLNGDGIISPDKDREYLGTPFPVYNFGTNITAGYKGFDFQIELQGVAGNKIYTQRRTSNFAVLNYEANRLNAWTGPGTSNIEPILNNRRGQNFLFSSYYLEPGDYLRIRTLQLGYTLQSNFAKKIGMQNARFYISGQNIAQWSQVTGYSPEAQIGSILGGGADNGSYPVPAIYTFGFNLTF